MQLKDMACVLFLTIQVASPECAVSASPQIAVLRAPDGARPTLQVRGYGTGVLLEVARPAGLGRPGRELSDGPLAAVWGMLQAFADRSDTGYTAWMSDDFRFGSDDPDFRASSPGGMDRAAEAQFAQHLFRGGKLAPDGRPLPTATSVKLTVGPVSASLADLPGGQVRVLLPHLEVSLEMADGSRLELGETESEMLVVRTAAGWRVRRWQERHLPMAALDSVVTRLAGAAASQDSLARSRPVLPRVTAAIEPMLLMPHLDRAREALVFDVALPAAGGTLEVFDVMGRQVMRHDLSDMSAGRHAIALDAHDLGAGVYWARLRQNGNATSAKLVWTR